jgi:polyketide synthase 5
MPTVCTAVLDRPGDLNFRLESQAKGEAQVHASARLSAAASAKPPATYDLTALRAAHATPVAADEVWRWFDSQGIQFGPSFRALAPSLALSADGASLFADLRLPASLRTGARGYTVHPVLLDACFQSVGAFARVVSGTNGRLLLPFSVRSLRLHGADADVAHCITRFPTVISWSWLPATTRLFPYVSRPASWDAH